MRSDLPVFKQEKGNYYLFYSSAYGAWVVDNTLDKNDGYRFLGPRPHTLSGLKAIPRFGWFLHDGTTWVVDETLIISAGDAL